jgi:hypothetical protein
LPRAPHNGWKTGHPSPEKPIQAKKPEDQKMKQQRNHAKHQRQSGI